MSGYSILQKRKEHPTIFRQQGVHFHPLTYSSLKLMCGENFRFPKLDISIPTEGGTNMLIVFAWQAKEPNQLADEIINRHLKVQNI